jgi:hypothetical protein
VQRKGIALFLGLALAFALMPGVAALWLSSSSAPEDASTALIPVIGESPTVEVQLTLGIDAGKSECPFETGPESSRF